MNRAQSRLAHAYAVRSLRRLGRKLTTGEWGGEPLSVNEAVTVIVRASAIVMRLGVDSVIAAADDALNRMVQSLLGPSED